MRVSLRWWYLQIKGYLVFRRRVGVLGDFKVVNPRNVSIGVNCGINEGVYILGHYKVKIGDRVVLSARCMLIDSELDKEEFFVKDYPRHIGGPIRVEDGAWIGAGAIILSNVTIGRKAIVGAGAVVTNDVAPFSIVAGSPAKIIGMVNE